MCRTKTKKASVLSIYRTMTMITSAMDHDTRISIVSRVLQLCKDRRWITSEGRSLALHVLPCPATMLIKSSPFGASIKCMQEL